MKGQNLLDRLSHSVVQSKSNAGLRLLLPALEFQPQFDEEQFFKDQTDVRGRARRLQIREALPGLRPMNFPQRLAGRNQRQTRAYGGRDRLGEVGSQIVQSRADDPAKPARGHAPLPGRLVNRYDSPNFERRSRFVLRAVSTGIAQHLKLWLHNLQLSAARVLLNLPIECDQLAGLELILQVSAVEPQATQLGSSLAHRELEDGHLAGAKQA